MKIKHTYIAIKDGVKGIYAVRDSAPEDVEILEVKDILIPDFGKVLRHKETGDISSGHWLKDDSVDNWEEIDEPQEEQEAE